MEIVHCICHVQHLLGDGGIDPGEVRHDVLEQLTPLVQAERQALYLLHTDCRTHISPPVPFYSNGLEDRHTKAREQTFEVLVEDGEFEEVSSIQLQSSKAVEVADEDRGCSVELSNDQAGENAAQREVTSEVHGQTEEVETDFGRGVGEALKGLKGGYFEELNVLIEAYHSQEFLTCLLAVLHDGQVDVTVHHVHDGGDSSLHPHENAPSQL